jgi:hypothetical protein
MIQSAVETVYVEASNNKARLLFEPFAITLSYSSPTVAWTGIGKELSQCVAHFLSMHLVSSSLQD